MGGLFLHPALLWGLAALLVPIVLHFLFRRPEQRMPWAAMDLLRRAVEKTASRSRRRERWLLLLRLAVLALLALAFASPLVRDAAALRFLGAEGAPVVLVVDGSLSMQARAAGGATLFESARARAIDLARSISAGSRTSLVVACSEPRVVLRDEISPSAVEAALRALQPTSLGDDDAGTRRLLETLPSGARTFWLSDFAGAARELPAGVERVAVACGDATNAAVESLEVAREPGVAGPWRATATVRRFGTVDEREIALSIDGVERERRRLDFSEGDVARAAFAVASLGPGFHEARVQLDSDARGYDDSRTTAFWVRAPVRVRVFEPLGATPHLGAALRAVAESASNLEIASASPDEIERTAPAPGDVWILSGVADVSDAGRATLEAARDAGVAFLWFVEPASAAMPGLPAVPSGARDAAGGSAHLAPVDPDHAILRPLLARNSAALERIGARRWAASSPLAGAEVVARVEPSGDPAIVELPRAAGRGGAIAFLVPASPAASDLPLPVGGSHAFVPLLAASLERLAPAPPIEIERRCGEPHGLLGLGDATLVDRAGLLTPLARFADLAPGVYQLASPRLASEGRVVVTADPRESDPACAPAPAAGEPRAAVLAAGFPLLGFVAALLVVEAALACLASREQRTR
jgi:aerotolerance regulator-like protein/VWA domain-containing protein